MVYENREAFEKNNMFGTGTPNTGYAQYFIGDSFLNPLTDPKTGLFVANVMFEPGCRNNWHIHHASKGGGQLLLCTAGEVWSREEQLSLRDRSLVTVVALMAQGLTDESFRYHLMSAKKNGITKEEIAEIVTHAAFYCGWPKAWAVFRMAKEIWND